MLTFKYVARDALGVRKEGFMEAAYANDVLSWLRERGFTPIAIDEAPAVAKKRRFKFRKRRIKSSDLAAFCWQLTTMIEGGVPVTTALDTIAEDIENIRLQQVIQQVSENIKKGMTFSDSVAGFPRVFNQLFCAMILAGESGGTLPTTLRRMAEYFDSRDKLMRKVRSATAYPAFVLCFIVFVVVFIMAFIIPQFQTIFRQIGGNLPAFTRTFMGVYNTIHSNLVFIFGTLLLIVILLTLIYTKTARGHYFFSKVFLRIPLFGKILREAFVAIFCRSMSTLIAAGVSVLEVFDILAVMSKNDIIKSAIIRAREHIVGGANIATALTVSGFFPNMVVKMVQIGEDSGALPKVLDRTSDFYERKVDSTITTAMSFLEPLMIISVGAIVLTVVLALYLPIFTMSDIRR